MKPKPPLEKETQKAILTYLQMKGYFFWRNNSGGFKTEKGGFIQAGLAGSPDIIGCHGGRFIGFEVKRSTKHPLSTLQANFKAELERAGGQYEVVTSLDDVIRLGF